MHKITVVLLLTLIPFFGMSQNTVSGKIVDELGLPIYMASVELNQTDDITYTDYDGVFTLTSNKDFHWKINIKSKGYKTASFFVIDGGKTNAITLEYDEEMQRLLENKTGLYRRNYRNLYNKFNFFLKPRKEFILVSRR